MAAGIGSILGGVGSLFSGFMNADAQKEAARTAQQNAMLQYMLGNRNIDTQEALGNRSLDLQELFGNRNFDLQKSNAEKGYGLASGQGNRVIDLIEAMTKQNMLAKQQGLRTQREGLDTQEQALQGYTDNTRLQRRTADENVSLAKASRYDSHGNETYYDPATKSFKVKLAPQEQALMEANQAENLKRSTVDQARARRGNEANEANRQQLSDMLRDAVGSYKYGASPVNEGELANQLIVAGRGEQEDRNRAYKEGLNTTALRTGNSGSIRDNAAQFRRANNSFGTGVSDSILKAKELALNANNQDRQTKMGMISQLLRGSTFTGDANNQMGDSSAFDTTTRQADAGGDRVARANAARADGLGSAILSEAGAKTAFGGQQKAYGLAEGAMGDTYLQQGQLEGDAIKSRTGAMINALTNGAAAQGSALTSAATGQSNAYNNLMSSLANAYTNQADNTLSAQGQAAKFQANAKTDLSGIGSLGSGLSDLLLAYNSDPTSTGGGTSTLLKTDRQRVF